MSDALRFELLLLLFGSSFKMLLRPIDKFFKKPGDSKMLFASESVNLQPVPQVAERDAVSVLLASHANFEIASFDVDGCNLVLVGIGWRRASFQGPMNWWGCGSSLSGSSDSKGGNFSFGDSSCCLTLEARD